MRAPLLRRRVVPPACFLLLAALAAPATGSPPALEVGAPPGGRLAFGDRLQLPVFLNLAADGFQSIRFGLEADPGLVILFAFDERFRREGFETFVTRIWDSRRILAGLGRFTFTGEGDPVAIPDLRLEIGTLYITVTEDSAAPVTRAIRLGACRCNDPGAVDPAFAVLPGGARLDFVLLEQPFEIRDDDFVRGDVNQDGALDISDPVRVLEELFLRALPPEEIPCHDAMDANDDGAADISDAVFLLGHLFLGTEPPRPPFPGRGPDSTADRLHCRHFRR